ncbi:MAG TPA: hypothetical protein VMS75_08955 [Terriglobales bacterium]|nr:hypothetical protein [Terriglobales bacterium]
MLPYRLALAGGWIDRPFVSARNPDPPGSMVVVSLEPDREDMDRSGRECYDAILARNVVALGASLNRTMACWEAILPRA